MLVYVRDKFTGSLKSQTKLKLNCPEVVCLQDLRQVITEGLRGSHFTV
ncbi:hypothetical protein PBCV1_a448aL [Paramecium bursaria Chlorella virus 1]|uniref:Uncharacterized protein n=1 Tax=Paramecium bursaria Chlorella virus 1 TaxID=10506 RepID=F8TU41_PBCV1|nr:hypothetical protein PBCV1_a448aL [Paramecium bursaria Chlorella virus 1]AEI70102.1 hypothetical protein [Paramecium bursaria Chlorella virus 1]